VWHPDKYVNNPRLRDKAEKQLKQINMAYDMLIQLFCEREQTSKEQEHKEQEERQRQEQGRAKQEGEESGQRKRITERGSLTVVKIPSRFFWWFR
jgi:curved DNA-binding protein CbpA